jgi:hypothetical protein
MGQSRSTTETALPQWQQDFVTGTVVPQAEKIAGQEFTGYGGQFAPSGVSDYTAQAAGAYGGVAGLTPDAYQGMVSQNMGGYTDQVIDATLARMDRDRAIDDVRAEANIIGSGAFDNSRRGIYEAERDAAYDLNRASTVAGLLDQGYGRALGATNAMIGQQLAGAGGLMGAGAADTALQGAQLQGEYAEFLREQGFEGDQLAKLLGVGGSDYGRTTTESYRPGAMDYITAGFGLFA